jgi:hypothetical protein
LPDSRRSASKGRIGGRARLIVNRDELARLDEEGLTMAEIGQQLAISAASVCRMLKAHRIQRRTSQAIA